MDTENLVRMANDIGNFFHSESGPDEAPKSIATHIRRYWEARMRARIIEHWRAGGEGLTPETMKAVELLVALNQPKKTG